MIKFKAGSPSWNRYKSFISVVVFMDCKAGIVIRVLEITDEPINLHLCVYDIACLMANGITDEDVDWGSTVKTEG